MIRQRPNRLGSGHAEPPSLDETLQNNNGEERHVKLWENQSRIRKFLCWMAGSSLHVASLLWLATGVAWTFRTLYTSHECDMTWSQRHFIRIDFPVFAWRGRFVPQYRVYKFMDHRDPRHVSFLDRETVHVNDTSWCIHTSPEATGVVLYVPGHGGSYEQSRSLGAHGTQLTGRYSGNQYERQILHQLRQLESNTGNTTRLDAIQLSDFFYDVYAIDFGEEGGGFHGARIERQAAFIATAVQRLANTCGYTMIQIVAHSIGGISARLALTTHPSMAMVPTLVTLGTPHQRPVLNWEPGMRGIYRQIQTHLPHMNDACIISVSGGLRDEMIPPETCRMDQRSRHWSLLSTDIIKPGNIEAKDVPPELGMDHRAIAWCHNLLSQIRHILYLRCRDVGQTDGNHTFVTHFLHQQGINEAYDYGERIQAMHDRLKIRYGFWTSLIMETSLLYNVELLVTLYTCVGSWRYLGLVPLKSMVSFLWLPSIGTAVVVYIYEWLGNTFLRGEFRQPALLSLMILSLAADGVFLGVCGLLTLLLRGRQWSHTSAKTKKSMAPIYVGLASLGMAAWLVAFIGYGEIAVPWLRPQAVWTVGTCVAMIVCGGFFISKLPPVSTGPNEWSARQVSFVAWVAVVAPFIAIGDLIVVPDGLTTWTVPVTFIPVIIRLALSLHCISIDRADPQRITQTLMNLSRKVVCGWGCWTLLSMKQLDAHASFDRYFHPLSMPVILANACDLVEMVLLFKRG